MSRDFTSGSSDGGPPVSNANRRTAGTTRRLFVTLLREEWRLHTRLFGGWRFALFPVVIAALAVGATVALLETGTAEGTIMTGIHVLALGFGLYSGTAGFAGSDMLENVFGRLSLVLSTSTTLPLSRKRLLGVFLVKDALFYAVAFVLPMALAGATLEGVSATAPVAVGALWLSLVVTFLAGMALTVALIAIRTQGVPTWAILGLIVAGVVSLWVTGSAGAVRNVLIPLEGAPIGALGLLVGTVLTSAGALALYDPTYGRPSRTAGDRFADLSDRLPVEAVGADSALVSKTLLDLARSSGGVAKPFVSAAVLLALVAALVGVVDSITGVAPAPGIFFGGVLGLTAFTTYNWLTQFDSLEDYLAYPVSIADVFRAKRVAFVVVGTPTVAVPYLAAVVWFEAALVDAAVGALLLVGYALYYYGLTVYIAGFDPNEFLFDAVRFSLFTLGVAVALVPTLVVGFVVVPPTGLVALALGAAGVGFGAIGVVLSSRAGPRWETRYRSSD
ncbi:hypothetical protein [Natronolimnohabitans innermongolicus]|uniref:Uncharacterized protein n=1 Tax=Natronolimnohabitans innermongolicus JCM 12255 TaxID=1227499 RepID=L9WJP3_9EURY|nr:hypothetical protein [Natronolimnohabitans innermongolicus]ELY48563.1 hypothetical protein C493_22056 [Natronolimnohabitans innermongolicus JCM 12255]